ncbi:MAG: FMN-binding protein [Myxococcota bacterium]
MKDVLMTGALLSSALVVEWVVQPPEPERALAEQVLGPVQRLPMPGAPAFQAGNAVMLFFDETGVQGPLRGAVVVDGGSIRSVIILDARDGPDRQVIQRSGLADRFRGLPARPPVVVDAISGASASSQKVIAAVNRRLKEWQEWPR